MKVEKRTFKNLTKFKKTKGRERDGHALLTEAFIKKIDADIEYLDLNPSVPFCDGMSKGEHKMILNYKLRERDSKIRSLKKTLNQKNNVFFHAFDQFFGYDAERLRLALKAKLVKKMGEDF